MMTDDECCRVIAAVKKVAAKEKLIFAGTGRESEYHTIEFTKRIAQYGVDAVFVLTPHYFPKQMGQDLSLIHISAPSAELSRHSGI